MLLLISRRCSPSDNRAGCRYFQDFILQSRKRESYKLPVTYLRGHKVAGYTLLRNEPRILKPHQPR
ncbi:hypothetical protein PAXRUDRAFT_615040 [Paxillus rubicundulus Ve08.2h10]|uniref:Uncharacterized protein n=1 Tax=Paxillus rubicundulus Ve08.2h10 TaxID=930991 RepID=A0A0D0DTA9_9AGAM|nr:hypothetical protein PAXRUDRAFT_615040 [Paxillus rubicundulus Ve08.2h10]